MSRPRPHWCDICHGFTGPDSPCYSGPEDGEQEEPDGDPDAERDRQQDDDNETTEGTEP